MKRALSLALVAAFLSATLGTTRAAPRASAAEAEGKKRYARGQELYLQGKYVEAAHEFEAGYAVVPRAPFLFNIGNAYRRAGELAKAKRYYQQLLQQDPAFSKRSAVEADIKAIDDALSLAEPVAPAAPAPAAPEPVVAAALAIPPPAPAPVEVKPEPAPPPPPPVRRVARLTRLAPAPSVPNLVDHRREAPAAPRQESDSIFKKPWFWVIVGGVIAGATAGAIVAFRKDQSCPGNITLCVNEGQH